MIKAHDTLIADIQTGSGRSEDTMKKYFWRIITDQVVVPDHLQRETGLPGDPRGDICTGYARTKAELIPLARLDRANGGRPVISRVRPPTEEDRMRGDRHPVEVD